MQFGHPLPALSINQPWAGLVAVGAKDVENRSWPTKYRGLFHIHAGLTLDRDAWEAIEAGFHPVTAAPLDRGMIRAAIDAGAFERGGIVGMARLVGCVTRSASPWFVGPYGFVLDEAERVPLRPCVGALGFFTPDFASRYAPKRSQAAPRAGAPPAAIAAQPAPPPAPAKPSTLPLFPEEPSMMFTSDNPPSRKRSAAARVLGGRT